MADMRKAPVCGRGFSLLSFQYSELEGINRHMECALFSVGCGESGLDKKWRARGGKKDATREVPVASCFFYWGSFIASLLSWVLG